MADGGRNLCLIISFILSLGFLLWGFIELLQKKQPNESETSTISRQLRGIGYLILSQVILVLGFALCFAMTGGRADLRSWFGNM